ncbi:HLA class II histocompatibility antigen, DM beta chain [Mixophyes fleayi]|uniref:HLA class II histocompatibility antigen, DM beta chain n=1 Tax=Mixophyes fleayi TaxID=3061075 RepID=UPI003F4DBDAC
MRGSFAGLLLVYSCIYYPVTGFVMQEISSCSFGDNKQGNITFQYFISFNRQPVLGYDEDGDVFFPCSIYQCITQVHNVSAQVTTELNANPDMAKYVKNEKKRCTEEVRTFWDNTVDRRVKPSMEVFSPVKVNVESLPVLVCFVWGFFPQNIIVAWIKNGEAVVKNYTEGVRAGDWTYQIVSKLDLRDSLPEDNYTCVVEHESLDQPMMKTWKAGLTSTQIIKISISAVVFSLGLILLVTGFACWKNARTSGYTPITGYNDAN